MVKWIDNIWIWNLLWRRELFSWKEPIFLEFHNLLQMGVLFFYCGGDYSVKSANETLLAFDPVVWLSSVEEEAVMYNLWKSLAPSKVIAFAWQMLADRIPSRQNLVRHCILPPEDITCILRRQFQETSIHLFCHCPVSAAV
ncbi:hypothetical protein CR513_39395, partial [Mucuna pruriens]